MAKIALDAGHGRFTAGKRCWKAIDPNETREWVLNSRIASYVDAHLQRCGISTMRVDDITGKTDVSLFNRVKKANNWGADLYLSFHANAGIRGKRGGGIANYSYAGSKRSAKLRDILYKHMIEETGLKGNRSNPCTTANFYVICRTTMAACLMECGFMDSLDDTPIILTDDFARKCALGIAKGACEYLGIKFADGSVPSKPATPSKPTTPSKPSAGKLESCSGYITIIYGGNEGLSYHRTPDFNSSSVAGTVKKGTVLTVVGRIKVDGGTLYKTKAGWYITASEKYVKYSKTTSGGSAKPNPYYPKYTGNSYVVDTVLKAIGVPDKFRGSWEKRKPIAKANGISNYKGTSSQNNKLCNLARQGKLKKA